MLVYPTNIDTRLFIGFALKFEISLVNYEFELFLNN